MLWHRLTNEGKKRFLGLLDKEDKKKILQGIKDAGRGVEIIDDVPLIKKLKYMEQHDLDVNDVYDYFDWDKLKK